MVHSDYNGKKHAENREIEKKYTNKNYTLCLYYPPNWCFCLYIEYSNAYTKMHRDPKKRKKKVLMCSFINICYSFYIFRINTHFSGVFFPIPDSYSDLPPSTTTLAYRHFTFSSSFFVSYFSSVFFKKNIKLSSTYNSTHIIDMLLVSASSSSSSILRLFLDWLQFGSRRTSTRFVMWHLFMCIESRKKNEKLI